MRFLFPLALLKLSLSCVGGDDESETVEPETVGPEVEV